MKAEIYSEIASLLGSIHIGSKNPFLLGVLDINCSKYDLIRLHFESRSEFLQSNCLMVILFVNVMSETNEVLIV